MGLIFAISSFSNSLIFSTKLFLLEIVPSLYLQVFTPLPLFFLLNLLIISILAISHLCKEAAPRGLAPQSAKSTTSVHSYHETQYLFKSDHHHHHADYQAKFAEIIGNALYGAANHLIVREPVTAGDLQETLAAKYSTGASDQRSVQLHSIGDHRPVDRANGGERTVRSDENSAADYFMSQQPIDVSSEMLHDLLDDCKDHGRRRTAGDYSDRLQANQRILNKKVPAGADRQSENALSFPYGDTCRSLEAEFERRNADHERAFISPGGSQQEQERPLALTRFTSKKASGRMHQDVGRSNSPNLKISRPSAKRGDTLDATWKAICEDKSRHSSPLTRHHRTTNHARKGDHHLNAHNTESANVSRGSLLSPSSSIAKQSTRSTCGLMRKRELSISRDELNARVESFISKFHEQIRIQREESLINYRNMVSRGAN